MNIREIEDLLSRQADQLLAGEKTLIGPGAAGAMAGLGSAAQRRLAGLMRLAARLRASLTAVEPRPAFVAEVKERLLAAQRATAATMAPVQAQQRLMWMAGLGGAAYLAGLGVVSYMAARAGTGLLRGGAGGRAPAGEGGRAQPVA